MTLSYISTIVSVVCCHFKEMVQVGVEPAQEQSIVLL